MKITFFTCPYVQVKGEQCSLCAEFVGAVFLELHMIV